MDLRSYFRKVSSIIFSFFKHLSWTVHFVFGFDLTKPPKKQRVIKSGKFDRKISNWTTAWTQRDFESQNGADYRTHLLSPTADFVGQRGVSKGPRPDSLTESTRTNPLIQFLIFSPFHRLVTSSRHPAATCFREQCTRRQSSSCMPKTFLNHLILF